MGELNNNRYREPNRVYVSQVGNPFRFPAGTRYTVGSGTILGERSLFMNVSDRNFGQYPIIVFSIDGVWTLWSGRQSANDGDVVHDGIRRDVQAPTPISPILCSIPQGIIYIAHEGYQLLTPRGAINISEVLHRRYQESEYIVRYSERGELVTPEVKAIYYVPALEEVRIIREGANTLVFSLITKRWHTIATQAVRTIRESYPHTLVLYGDGSMRDEGTWNERKPVRVQFRSRPLRFGSRSLIKRLRRLALRGLLYVASRVTDNEGFIIKASNSGSDDDFSVDGNAIVSARPIGRGTYRGEQVSSVMIEGEEVGIKRVRDIDSGLMVRFNYRFYTIELIAYLDPRTRIEGLESIAPKRVEKDRRRTLR